MHDLSVVLGQQYIRVLTLLGYVVVRTRGSHVRLRAPVRSPVTVPPHRELDRGTLKSILDTAEISVEEFLQMLKG